MSFLPLKDYYAILELAPSANAQEIRQAYRRMAMIWHPDKHDNNLSATTRFNEIKEAYDVLTNPGRKEAYLQKRWYQKSTVNKFTVQETFSPLQILKQCLELNRHVSTLNALRIDQEGLSQYIHYLISDIHLSLLGQFKEAMINEQIIQTLLDTCRYLNYKFIPPILGRLKKLTTDIGTIALIMEFDHRRQRLNFWDRHKVVVALVISILICGFIYVFTR